MAVSTLPPSLADALRPVLPGLAEETIAAIGRDVEDYRRPLEGPFGQTLRAGVERSLERFVDNIAHPGGADARAGGIYLELGRGEQRAGRSLAALLSAYRIGARLAWERFVAAAEAAGHAPATLYALAGAIFSYIDAISAESVEGYAQEQSREAGERERRRRALVRLLGRDDVAQDEVADLAELAGWPLPAQLAAIVATGADAEHALARLGPDAVVAGEDGVTIAFLADPDAPGRRAQLEAATGRLVAALGPAVAPPRASHSLARARATHRLLTAGRLPHGRLAVADEHLLDLLLHAGDPALAADLASRALAPLEALAPGPRAKLTATLRCWLDHPGQVQRVAALLGVHPQTVRYRVGRLRELFGDALEDTDQRFALGVALRIGE